MQSNTFLNNCGIPMNPDALGLGRNQPFLHPQVGIPPHGFQQTVIGNGQMTTRVIGMPQNLLHHVHTPHGLVRATVQPPKPTGFTGGGGQHKQHKNGSGVLLFDHQYSKGPALIVVRECTGKHAGKWATFYGKVNPGDTSANGAKKELREESLGALKMDEHTVANLPFVPSPNYPGQGVFVAKVAPPIKGGGLQLKKVFARNASVISAQNGPHSFRETDKPARILLSDLQQALQMQPHGDVFVVGSHGEQIILRARECSFLRVVFQQMLHITAPVLQATFNPNIRSRIPCLNGTQCYELA